MNYKHSLLVILVVSLVLRLALISGAETFEPQAYHTIRQVEHIKETGLPLIQDNLQERTLKPLPIFAYILAFSSLFLPDNIAYLLIPNILAVMLQLAIYVLTVELTHERRVALLAAAASVFIPSYLSATLLSLSSIALALPLFLLTITLYLKLRKSPEKRLLLLTLFLILCFTSTLAILFVPFLLLSILLSAIKHVKGETAQQEFGIFAIFFLLWFNLIIYKSFLEYAGPAGFRGLTMSFPAIAAAIGVVPFSLALYAAYKEAGTENIGPLSALSAAIAICILLAAGYLPQMVGLATLASLTICLGAVGLQRLATYSRHLKRHGLIYAFVALGAVLFALTSVLPSLTTGVSVQQNTIPQELVEVSLWLEENSPKSSLVLTDVRWGAVVEAIAKRKVFADDNYVDSPSYRERADVDSDALAGDNSLLIEHHIEYVLGVGLDDNPCLNIVQGENIQLGKVVCS